MNPKTISLPLKTVVPVPDIEDLPKPIRKAIKDYRDAFDNDEHKLYLVDGEFYVQYAPEDDDDDRPEELLRHWTAVADDDSHDYDEHNYPIVRQNGEYIFETRKTGSYETSVKSLVDGKTFVVHDG